MLLWSVEALLRCCGVGKPCYTAMLPFPGPLRFIPGHSWAPRSTEVLMHQHTLPFTAQQGRRRGKEGSRNHIKHPETGVQSGRCFCKVTQGVRRRVTDLHAWTQTLPSQTMRLRGEAGFRLNSSCGLGEQTRFSRLHFLFMLLGTWRQRLEASNRALLLGLRLGYFPVIGEGIPLLKPIRVTSGRTRWLP